MQSRRLAIAVASRCRRTCRVRTLITAVAGMAVCVVMSAAGARSQQREWMPGHLKVLSHLRSKKC